jgi:cytochrome c2
MHFHAGFRPHCAKRRRLIWRTAWLATILALIAVLAACQPIQPVETGESSALEVEPTPEMMLPEGDPEAGRLVLSSAIGCGCHFNGDLGALAGGNAFEGDFGVVYTRNLTPHATGIAAFTDEQLADAIRFGKGADGRNLFIMPHYAGMADQDVADLIAYLRSMDPVENEVPDRELAFEPPAFEITEEPPAVAPTEPVARGEYLVSLARCTMCHTPSNDDGSPNMDMFLAGAPFRSSVAPNLTPDEATGLGIWTDDELVEFLATGVYFDGTEPGAAMKNIIDRGISQLTDEDRQAIVAFLRSLPPVLNEPAPAE